MRHFDRFAHVALQVALLVHDFHGAATQHVAGSNHQGVTQGSCLFQSLWFGSGRGIRGLAQTKFLQQFLEPLAIFRRVDHVRAGANDGDASSF